MARKRVEKNLAFDDQKKCYYAYFDYGVGDDGRRIRSTQCFQDKEAAQQALRCFALQRPQRQTQMMGGTTVGEWLRYWLEDIVRPNRESTTYYCYHCIIKNHLIPALGAIPLHRLLPYQIQHYYLQMMEEKGLSANTVYKHHILLHTALKAAYRQSILPENPVDRVEPPRLQQPRRLYYDSHQLKALFQAVEGRSLELPVKLAGYLGLRRGEICGLRWENVDLQRGLIWVRRVRTTAGEQIVEKQPKTTHSVRQLAIGGLEELMTLLRAEQLRQQAEQTRLGEAWRGEGYVVVQRGGAPTNPNQLTAEFGAFVREKGLPPITIHGLRHTFASVANSAKVPLLEIGKALGHKDITITGRIYTHIFDQTHQSVLNTVAAQIMAG